MDPNQQSSQQNINPISPNPTPSEPQTRNSSFIQSRLSPTTLLILALFIIAFIGIYIGVNLDGSSPQKQTTYVNERMGISLEYPPGWTAEEYQENFIKVEPQGTSLTGGVINITSIDNPDNLSLKELNEKLIGPSGKSPQIYYPSQKEIKLESGATAYHSQCYFTGLDNSKCEQYIIPYGKKVLRLTNTMNESIPDQMAAFDLLLSTLKFSE